MYRGQIVGACILQTLRRCGANASAKPKSKVKISFLRRRSKRTAVAKACLACIAAPCWFAALRVFLEIAMLLNTPVESSR